MIRAVFQTRKGLLVGFEIEGHAGDVEEGRNLVCAAVSSAAYMTVNTITEILDCEIECIEDDGYMKIDIIDRKNRAVSDLLKGLRLHMSELSNSYPDFIKVSTEE